MGKGLLFIDIKIKKFLKKTVKIYTEFILKNILKVFKSLVQCPQTDNLSWSISYDLSKLILLLFPHMPNCRGENIYLKQT